MPDLSENADERAVRATREQPDASIEDWQGRDWFKENGFDAFLVNELLESSDLMRLSAHELWLVKLKVIDELTHSMRVRRWLKKVARQASKSVMR